MAKIKKYPETKCNICNEVIKQGKMPEIDEMSYHYCKVEVEWLDAQTGFGNAEFIEELEKQEPIITHSIGYLLYENQNHIVLGFMLFGKDMCKHTQLIPRKIIKKIKYLVEDRGD